MPNGALTATVVFQLGPLQVTSTTVTTWVIMIVCGLLAWGAAGVCGWSRACSRPASKPSSA